MAKGQRDFGLYAPTDIIGGMSDMGELAARLGSIVTFDRRGNVIFADNFESGIQNWYPGGIGSQVIEWCSQYSRDGGFSCKLETDTDEDDSALITRHVGYPVLSIMGMEISISDKQNWKFLYIRLLLTLAGGQWEANVRYDYTAKTLLYLNSLGTYTAIPGASYDTQGNPSYFDTIKLVADFVNYKYKRLTLNDTTYALSGIGLRWVGGLGTPNLHASIELFSDGVGAAIGYVDSIILTQNEP